MKYQWAIERNGLLLHITNLDELQENYAESKKKKNPRRIPTAWFHLNNIREIIITEVENRLVVPRSQDMGRGGYGYKGVIQGSLVLMVQLHVMIMVVVTWSYMWINCIELNYTHTHSHSHMGTCIISEMWVISMDYTNVSFLVLNWF